MASFKYPVEIVPAVGIISSLLFWVFIAIVAPKPPILLADVNICHKLLSSTVLNSRTRYGSRGAIDGNPTTVPQYLELLLFASLALLIIYPPV